MTREDLFRLAEEAYGTVPDYPWPRDPHSAVLRHPGGGKWFGVVLRIPPEKLGLPPGMAADVLNLKAEPLLLGGMADGVRIFPAYHMNRRHWISLMLSRFSPAELSPLLDMSWTLTRPKLRGPARPSGLDGAVPRQEDGEHLSEKDIK